MIVVVVKGGTDVSVMLSMALVSGGRTEVGKAVGSSEKDVLVSTSVVCASADWIRRAASAITKSVLNIVHKYCGERFVVVDGR